MTPRLIGALFAALSLSGLAVGPAKAGRYVLAAQSVAAALPRTADGKPDLSGIWQVMNSAAWDIQDHSAQKGVPAGQGVVEGNDIPYKPEALAQKKKNYDQRATMQTQRRESNNDNETRSQETPNQDHSAHHRQHPNHEKSPAGNFRFHIF